MDNDDLLQYAKDLVRKLEEEARIEAIKQLQERFSLSPEEAEDIVDEAYEELYEEEYEDIDEEEEEAESYPEIIDQFIESLKGSYDENFQGDVGFLIDNLYEFLRDYYGLTLEDIDTDLLEEYLMDFFPRKVTADEEFVRKVPDILILFFKFAGERGDIEEEELIDTVESLRKEFIKAALDPRNFGPAKAFATAMLEAGVDIEDKDQVDAFMAMYNQMLAQQMPIKREEPKVGRNDPCPCGSGKKYKKCCGKS